VKTRKRSIAYGLVGAIVVLGGTAAILVTTRSAPWPPHAGQTVHGVTRSGPGHGADLLCISRSTAGKAPVCSAVIYPNGGIKGTSFCGFLFAGDYRWHQIVARWDGRFWHPLLLDGKGPPC